MICFQRRFQTFFELIINKMTDLFQNETFKKIATTGAITAALGLGSYMIARSFKKKVVEAKAAKVSDDEL